jgi:hypothetical protein
MYGGEARFIQDFGGESTAKETRGRETRKWEDDETGSKETGWTDINCIYLKQHGARRRL